MNGKLIQFDVNNQGVMTLQQVTHNGPVHVDVTHGGTVSATFSIPAGDMVLLLDWWRYAKNRNLSIFPEVKRHEP